MKKLALLFVVFISFVSYGQIGPYASFHVGYAFPVASDTIGTKIVATSNGDLIRTNIYSTYGTGINATLKAGFKHTQNFGVELGTNYLYGLKKTTKDFSGVNSSTLEKTQTSQLRIMPGIVLETSNAALTIYSRLGAVIPLMGKTFTESKNVITTGSSTNETITKRETNYGLSLGYYGAAGVSLKIKEKLKVFAEVELVTLKIKKKSTILTQETVNGSDVLDTYTTSQKETEYKDSYNSADNTDTSRPRSVRTSKVNFNGASINIGIRFNFLDLK